MRLEPIFKEMMLKILRPMKLLNANALLDQHRPTVRREVQIISGTWQQRLPDLGMLGPENLRSQLGAWSLAISRDISCA